MAVDNWGSQCLSDIFSVSKELLKLAGGGHQPRNRICFIESFDIPASVHRIVSIRTRGTYGAHSKREVILKGSKTSLYHAGNESCFAGQL